MATNRGVLETLDEREQAFINRYDALFKWACRLTRDAIEAEDVLHDCYVAYVSSNTNTVIENLDGYLHRMLSNINHSRHMKRRRSMGAPMEDALELTCDSNILNDIEERERQAAIKRQLRLIQNFALRRNNPVGRTKAGKVFVLRYYQNRSAAEVAKLVSSTPTSVDQWVRIARTEIKKHYKKSRTFLTN
jgi:DNA-directed RNA polymerase specialized sigma24 family protein